MASLKLSKEHKDLISEGLKNAYKNGRRKSWNLGLNKENDERIRKCAEKIRNSRIGNTSGMLGKKHSIECKKKISETLKGKLPWNNGLKGVKTGKKGWKHSEETKQKISIIHKGKIVSNITKMKMRKSAINYIVKQKGSFERPRIGRNETQILNHIEQMLNIKIQRQYQVAGYFLDGYCPERNLAFEVDESNHYDNIRLKEKDVRRQIVIQGELNCNFIRIKDKGDL